MRNILVKYCSNWSDEFDIQGFAIMNAEEYAQWVADYRKAMDTDYEWYFGTNEYISYWSFDDWSATNLSKEEVLNLVFMLDMEHDYYGDDYPVYGFFPAFYFDEEEEDA